MHDCILQYIHTDRVEMELPEILAETYEKGMEDQRTILNFVVTDSAERIDILMRKV